MKPREWTLEQLKVGTKACFEHCISDSDVDEFARLSGDYNPLHADQQFAKSTGFRDRVVHGAMLVALASRFVGMELPGRRSLLLSLKLDFVAPTFPGDIVEVLGRVESIHPQPRVVVLRLMISCGGELRARGSAMVRVGH
jgi:3-hydroxybutyryl-CoA dehydratase